MFKDMNNNQRRGESTGVAAINNSIRNILSTPYGSMPGRPTFGSHIYESIFEDLNPLVENLCRRFAEEALAEWEPRIDVTKIMLRRDDEYNRMVISIEYVIIQGSKELEGYTNHVQVALRE